MFCPKCGTTLPDGSVFCSNCGASLASDKSTPVAPQQVAPQQAASQRPVPSQPQVQYQQVYKQVIIQPKAKAGMAVGLLAALMAFTGMIYSVIPVILAAYVFIKEDDLWLRKAAVRIVGVIAVFAVLSGLVNVFFDVFRFINETIALFDSPVSVLYTITSVELILSYVITGLEIVFLFILGIKALSMQSIRIPVIDKLIDKHMA